MSIDIVHQYYKDLNTGAEMSFSKHSDYGWCISFPFLDISASFDYTGDIPWPKISTEEQAVVEESYKKLHEMMGREGG